MWQSYVSLCIQGLFFWTTLHLFVLSEMNCDASYEVMSPDSLCNFPGCGCRSCRLKVLRRLEVGIPVFAKEPNMFCKKKF